MDAGVESPLDVLSRAATMIQETQQQEDAAAAAKSQKQLPTTKWKRDRRTRPDYLRKSDPKYPPESPDPNPITNGNSTDKSSSSVSSSSSSSTSPVSSTSSIGSSSITSNHNKGSKLNGGLKSAAGTNGDGPLDMTTSRQRGLPPSYSQAISDPTFRSTYTSRPIVNGRDDIPTGISMCDPIIDEHFRRSLGKDYNTVFNNNAKETIKAAKPPIVVAAPVVEKPTTPVTSVTEMMDTTGLSVDDHFAKALGDTWHKLNNGAGGSNNKDSKNDSSVSNSNSVTSSPAEVVST